MSGALVVILALLPSVLCAGAAFYLAAHGQEGWAWFLFAAILLAGSVSGGGS